MKKLFLFLLVFSLLAGACSNLTNNASIIMEGGNLNISVSIPSIQWLVDQIGGEYVHTQSLTSSGDDPHTYEPSPSQMIAVAASDLYLTAGVEFEEVWIPKFIDANSALQVIDVSEGIIRIPIDDHLLSEDDEHDGLDPHIWLSPQNMQQIAQNITDALQTIDPQNSAFYKRNLSEVLVTINLVDSQLSQALSQTIRKQFLIIHPSLGYLADSYGLQMIPVEVNGQEPSPAELAEILNASESYGIHTLFTQTGTNPLNVRMLAEYAGITKIIETDPMAYDWPANVLFIGENLQEALN